MIEGWEDYCTVLNKRKLEMAATLDMATMMANLLAKGVSPALAAEAAAALVGNLAKVQTSVEKSVEKKTKKTKEPKEKTKTAKRERAPVEECDRCMARVWGNKETGFGVQCGLGKKSDSDFCPFHNKQALDGEEALMWTEEGAKKGLHLGRIDADMPWRAASGEVCYAELAPEGAVEALKESGEFKWHPFVKQGREASGTKAPKKERKPKEKKEKKAKKAKSSKPKRAPNAYMLFLNEKFENGSRREEVKAALEAESDGEKVTITAVTKKIAEMWREIKETDAGLPYIEKAAALKEALANQVDSEASSDNESVVSAPTPSPVASPVKPADGHQSAEDILAELGVHTPTQAEVDAAIAKAEKEGLLLGPDEEPPVGTDEDEEDEEVEEFEHEGKTYYKNAQGILYEMDDEGEPTVVGSVNEEGNVTLN